MSRFSGDELMAMGTDVYNKWFRGFSRWKEDIIMEAVAGLLKAEAKFDDSYGVSFLTFGYKCARNKVNMYLRREKKFNNLVADIEDEVFEKIKDNSYDNCDKSISYSNNIKLVMSCVGVMKPKYNAIANELIKGNAQNKVAEKYGVSRQRVCNIFNNIKKKVVEKYKCENGEMVER